MPKPTLVILPGWGGSHETWQNFIILAQERYTVVCIDLPCFGHEPCPSTVWGVEEYADFVKSKFSAQGVSAIILLGHSFGGQVAVYLTAHHPELVRQLILVGAAVCRPKQRLRRVLFGFVAMIGKLFFYLPVIKNGRVHAQRFLHRLAGTQDYNNASGIQRDIFKKIIRQDVSYLLPRITTPALVVWGAHDTYTPLRYGKKIVRLLPHTQFHLFSDGQHGLHMTHAKQLLSVVAGFIRS